MPTKDKLLDELKWAGESILDCNQEISKLLEEIHKLKLKTKKMRNTIADKDEHINTLREMINRTDDYTKHEHTIPEGTCSLG